MFSNYTHKYMCIILLCDEEHNNVTGHRQLLGPRSEKSNQHKVAKANTNARMVNSTSLYDSKVTLIFCIKSGCGPHIVDCYCCINEKPKILCYYKMDDCRANCPVCNPECPPQQSQSVVEDPPRTMASALQKQDAT